MDKGKAYVSLFYKQDEFLDDAPTGDDSIDFQKNLFFKIEALSELKQIHEEIYNKEADGYNEYS